MQKQEEKKLDSIGRLLEKNRIKNVLPFIKGRLLDIGCGMNNLVRIYGNGVGVDVFDWGRADLVVSDTSKLPFKDNEFDTITLLAAINHIPNRIEVLKECRRVLKNDGLLVITTIPPFVSRFWHFLRSPWDLDQKERGMAEGEVYGFNKKDLINLVQNEGFRLVGYKRFTIVNSISIFKKF